MTRWSFIETPLGHWYWRRERSEVGTLIVDQGRFFTSRADCVDDAIVHGLRAQDAWQVPGRDHVRIEDRVSRPGPRSA